MGITFTNNWKNISDKLRSTLRTEFKGALPVFINDEPISTGGQFIQLDLASTSLLQKLVGCEIREYTITMNYVYQNPNIKKSSLDHVLRYVSRIEQLMQNNISLSLADSTDAVNCRVESTTFEEGEDSYLVSFDYKCQHVSGLSEVISTALAFNNLKSLNFDGTNDHLITSASNALITGTNVTVSTWFKNSSGERAYIFQSRRGATSSNLSLGINFDGSGNEDPGYVGALLYTGSGFGYTVFESSVNDGNWHNLAYVATNGLQKLYLDGNLVATTTHAFSNAASSDTSVIGSNSGSNRFMNGNIDELAIWDTALDGDAVKAVYNGGKPTDLMIDNGAYDEYTDNIKGYWRMGDRGLAGTPDGIMSDDQNSDKLVFGHNDSLGDELINFSEWTGSGSAGTQEIIDNVIVLTDSITAGNTFRQNTINIEDNEYYVISFEVFDFVKGQLRFSVGNQVSGFATANGHYIFFVKHTSGLSRVYTYSGISTTLKVRNLSIKKLISSSVATMINMDTGDIEEDTP